MSNELIVAHLGFIQAVISRMGTNSFLIKGWVVTLVAAIFALSSKDANTKFIYLALFPLFFFWWLDAFYLHQERLYRALYNKVSADRALSESFTMDASPCLAGVGGVRKVLTSKTLVVFYGGILVVILFVICNVNGLLKLC